MNRTLPNRKHVSVLPPDDGLADVRARLEVLEQQIRQLQASRGPRDDADRTLMRELFTAALGLPWRASHVFRRAEAVPALAHALRDATIDSERQLGKWCARMEGLDVDGVRLVRGRRRLWQCVPC